MGDFAPSAHFCGQRIRVTPDVRRPGASNGTAWAEASDQIQLTPNGAAGTNTQHQVSFAGNLNTSGAISLLTPDSQQMTSQILGLVYFDSSTSNTALFAETQDSIGQLLPSGNQVIYTNAFSNAVCDVLYPGAIYHLMIRGYEITAGILPHLESV